MKHPTELTTREQSLLREILLEQRNRLLWEGKPTEDVASLLERLLTSPTKQREEKSDAER